MKKSLLFVLLVFPFYSSFAQIANHIVISEVYSAGNSGTIADWVELYNPTSQAVDISGWKIKYKSATGASASSSFTLSAGSSIRAYGYFLISSNGSMTGGAIVPDAISGSVLSFSSSAGHVALVRDGDPGTTNPLWGGILVDLLGYGATANAPEGFPATAPGTGSLQRKARGGSRSGSGNGYDSNNNTNDFVVSAMPGPQNSSSPLVVSSTAAFSNGYPTFTDLASTSLKINTQMAEDGKTYYVVLPDGAAIPSVQQVKEGKNANGDVVTIKGLLIMRLATKFIRLY